MSCVIKVVNINNLAVSEQPATYLISKCFAIEVGVPQRDNSIDTWQSVVHRCNFTNDGIILKTVPQGREDKPPKTI